MPETPVKWAAQLSHVREVSLLGTADLDFWADRLRVEGLTPVGRDGRAQVMVIAADARFMRVRFRELSFSVLARREVNGAPRDGAYLERAFNSRRFFAFVERTFFATPYEYGDVRVSAAAPASMALVRDGADVFRAAMGSDADAATRSPARLGEGGFNGPVFLPGQPARAGRPARLFFARIEGHTATYPFVHSVDSVTIHATPAGGVLAALVDSHFVADEWQVREDASHAKSKTVRTDDAFGGG